jgi:CrcB protein
MLTVLSISIGAALGALLRYWLGLRLNTLHPSIPPGTLIANLLGGFLIGLAITYFSKDHGLPPEVRLFIITGFLGGLTTFSTFSAEVSTLLSHGEILPALLAMSLHLGGSLLMTGFGMFVMNRIV